MMAGKKTVLLVDDEPSVRRVLERALRQDGYEVLAASDGNEALELIKAVPPDMVLLDLMMPGMDGMELCRRIREYPSTRHMPVIMVTAKGRIIDAVGGLDGGADDYIAKPFDPHELLARVAGLFRRCETETQAEKADVRRAAPSAIDASGRVRAENDLRTDHGVVLIVDDEPSVRKVISRVLRNGHPGCEVAEAADIPEAKKMLAQLRPRLLISDLCLPSGNGMDLCRFIQGHPWFYRTRVLIITGYPSPEVRENIFAKGACEFLPKPFQAEELADSIGRLLA